MSTQDAIGKRYMSNNVIFADAFNFFFFFFEPIIKPEALREADTAQIALPYGNNARLIVQRYRDLKKLWAAKRDENAVYVLLGGEIQQKVHYAMPVRDMLHDAIDYAKQVEETGRSYRKAPEGGGEFAVEDGALKIKLTSEEFLSGFAKTDRLLPVVTVVVYLGPGDWDGPLSLHEMMEVPDPRLYRVIPNYFVNLLAPARISDADFGKFNSELGVALKLLKYQDKGMGQAIRDLNHRKVSRLTAEFVNAQAKLNLVFEEPKEEGEIDMCKAMEDMIREEREDAAREATEKMNKAMATMIREEREDAAREATEKMNKAMATMIREEREDATQEATEKTLLQDVKTLMKNLNLTLEQAFNALDVPAVKRSRLMALL